MRSVTYTVQRDRHVLFVAETEQADGSHTFEIADDRNILPFGIAVVYDPTRPHAQQINVYMPASWSDGLSAEDFPCALAIMAEAAARAAALVENYGTGTPRAALAA